jgi:MATE family multidrug resistance protein
VSNAATATLRSELRAQLELAVPLAIVHLGNQLMSAVDTALSGRIDALAQAATGLGSAWYFFGALLGIGVTMGIDPLTAQAFGAGRPQTARQVLRQGCWVALLAAVPVTLLLALGIGCIEATGISPELAGETRRYVLARLLGVLPLLLLTTLRSYLQAAHHVRAIVAATVAANVFNFAADWLFIFGDAGLVRFGLPALGVPALGVAGIGWATTLATLLNLAIFAWAAFSNDITRKKPADDLDSPRSRPESIAVRRGAYRPDFALIRRIAALGLPIGLHMLAEIGIFTFAGVLAGRIGTVAMAAHQVALQLAALTFMVPLGIGAATTVRVGRAIGAHDDPGARRAGFVGIGLGAAFMSVSAVSMWSWADVYARWMSSDPAVLPLATQLIVIAGAFQLFDGIQVVSAGALRGAGVTRWTMAVNVFAYWFVALPLVLMLGLGMELGPRGIWWGLTIGLAVAAALLFAKFARASRAPIQRLDLP